MRGIREVTYMWKVNINIGKIDKGLKKVSIHDIFVPQAAGRKRETTAPVRK